MAGLDPEEAWERTPGELMEVVRADRDRQRRTAYMLYNHAALVASFRGGHTVKPWDAFPGIIERREMDEDELYAAVLAWTGG